MSLAGFALVVHRELSLHLSQPNVRALLAACATACGVAERALTPDHFPTIATQIERTFAVFGVRPDARARCIATLRAAAGREEHHSEVVIPILQEGDVVTARNAGKDICHALNFPEIAYVKVTTAISELARNILKYAGTGQISVRRLSGAREGIEVIATDQGPGIADIDAVLSPKYRSKTGMGVGLRGSRRLMDQFRSQIQGRRGDHGPHAQVQGLTPGLLVTTSQRGARGAPLLLLRGDLLLDLAFGLLGVDDLDAHLAVLAGLARAAVKTPPREAALKTLSPLVTVNAASQRPKRLAARPMRLPYQMLSSSGAATSASSAGWA